MKFVRNRVAVGVVIACSTAAMALAGPTPDAVAAGTCASRSNYFDGYNTEGRTQATALEGVRADISNPGGYSLCAGDSSQNNFATSWTMVVDKNLAGYAQSGYMYRAGYAGCVKLWAEQNIGGGFADYYLGGCVPVGDTHSAWQQIVAPSGGQYRIRSNVDTTIIRESTVNPFTEWPLPWGAQFEQETTYPQTSISGRVTSKQVFSRTEIQRYSDNVFVTTTNNTGLTGGSSFPTTWKFDAPASNQFRSWAE